MAKPMTPRQLEKEQRKREKEIAKWEKQRSQPKPNGFLIYLLLVVTIVYVVDEVATQIGTQMKTEIANGLFSMFGERSVGVSDIIGALSGVAVVFSILYRPLADKYGRKVFLFINTIGMGLGMFLVYLSNSIPMYLVGAAMINFFIPHDMQQVYILESAPSKDRGKIYSVIKACATLGIMLIPLLRRLFMHDVSQWRNVYMVPGIVGIVIAIVSWFLLRETDAFIDSRLKYLRDPDTLTPEKKKPENAQGSLGAAMKTVLKNKQLKWLYICVALVFCSGVISTNYQVIISYGYAESFLASGLYTDMDQALNAAGIGPVTSALFLFPIGSAAAQIVMGFLADKWGRRSSAISMGALSLVSFLMFSIGAANAWSASLVGLFCGLSVGANYAVGDVLGMMIAESSPTNLRVSIAATQMFPVIFGSTLGITVATTLATIFGNQAIGTVTLFVAIPGLTIGLIMLMRKTKDTKNVDMSNVDV